MNQNDKLTATVDQLQAELDRLSQEILVIALACCALAFAVMWRLWHE